MTDNYVRYSPEVEVPVEDEARLIAEITDQMSETNLEAFERHRHAIRDAHAKSHGVLTGTLTIPSDLPAHLRQGVFAQPGEYDVVARISSAPGDIHSDEIPQPRGFALKIMGVEGNRLLKRDDSHSQDFLMVNLPVLPFGDIPKYKQMLGLLEKRAHAPERVQRFGAAVARGLENAIEAVGATPGVTLQGLALSNDNLLGETFFTQGALRFGDYIGKVSLAPRSENVRALTGQPIEDMSYSRIEEVVRDFFRDNEAVYDLRVQLCTDLDEMPVEDAAILWDEEESPQQVIGTVRFAPQDSFSDARRVYADDVLSFNPWQGITAHQPLGSIMRIRRTVYDVSSDRRHRLNAVTRTEPASAADIPA